MNTQSSIGKSASWVRYNIYNEERGQRTIRQTVGIGVFDDTVFFLMSRQGRIGDGRTMKAGMRRNAIRIASKRITIHSLFDTALFQRIYNAKK